MPFRRMLCVALLATILRVGIGFAAPPEFEATVAPILIRRCLECHNERSKSGGLVLTTADLLQKGGESGAVVDTKTGSGLLLERVAAGEMPPDKQGKSQQLPDREIEILRQWVKAGAKWPKERKLDLYEKTSDVRGGRDWWSFQTIKRPEVPGGLRATHPVDAFILARLKKESMEPAPLADRRTLGRRISFDTRGLPLEKAQLERFINDADPAAWERLVEQMLASPQFGERWARHWLDVVRYAETCGYERDQVKPFVWKYRDWVVRAINQDKPYDDFIREQLAGDELPDRTKQTVVATGFLRLGTWNDEPNDPNEYKYERLEDMVHATSSAFLGLTVKCARCHDHKFDPILQKDYYRMAAAFWSGPIQPGSRNFLGGPTPEQLGYKDVLGWTDVKKQPQPLRLLKSGDPKHPLEVVEPGHLSTLVSLQREFHQPATTAKTSQRRLQLANWIADAGNPLTPRVAVNRIWQNYFGKGLVRSPNNFGFRGAQPTHPKLLDWLAAEFVASGWSVKHIHRLILTSQTYRRSSLHPQYADYMVRDSANALWWRAERRRLDAESLRDGQLEAAGQLDLRMGGDSFKPTISGDALEGLSRKAAAWVASPQSEQRRRSLYIHTKRQLLPPLLTTFDFSDTTLPCAQRDVTTVAPQALALMNNAFTHQQSSRIAEEVFDSEADPSKQIQAVWARILKREPTQDEIQLASQHLVRQRKAFSGSLDKSRTTATALQLVEKGLVLHLRADQGVQLKDGRVVRWQNQVGDKHHAAQPTETHQPVLKSGAINGLPALRFDGQKRFLALAGNLLATEHCTVIAVATDTAAHKAHREILSNWNRAGNSTTSIFLGLTGENIVRFSDAFRSGTGVQVRTSPFVLSAVNGPSRSAIYQNRSLLGERGGSLGGRKLQTPWVIGQQGNIDGEYWHGDIAELLVYNRPLRDSERSSVEAYLMSRYAIPQLTIVVERKRTPEELALASLCHVLLNSNEFIYVD